MVNFLCSKAMDVYTELCTAHVQGVQPKQLLCNGTTVVQRDNSWLALLCNATNSGLPCCATGRLVACPVVQRLEGFADVQLCLVSTKRRLY